MTTPLFESLRTRLRRDGPMTVAQYMAEVLVHPRQGYYSTRDPLGQQGDFITAPEISQMFGELIGLWCAEAWQRLGSPETVHLVELGPGRGTLMADALRAARLLPGFRDAIQVHLVEVSPALRSKQAETLAATGVTPTWHHDVSSLPNGPLVVIANEFFDALPVRQFEKTPDGWCERLVSYDAQQDRLAFALTRPSDEAAAYVPTPLKCAEPGAVIEVAPSAQTAAQDLGQRIATHGGAALCIDYGYAQPDGYPTLQAVRQHEATDVLAVPGSADLTALVDFSRLAAAFEAGGATTFGPVGQGDFLNGLGLATRAEVLKHHATAKQAADIDAASERLTGADQMGHLFKALAAVPPGYGTPAGFPETNA